MGKKSKMRRILKWKMSKKRRKTKKNKFLKKRMIGGSK